MRITLRAPRLLLAGLIATTLFGTPPAQAAGFDPEGEAVDLVIALDVSGTMRELIDSTRVKIWEIVNDLAIAEPTPKLRVALVTYGNQTGSAATGWVRVETDLTDDLDLISERLFALKGRGANEYVGRVLQTGIQQLSWSSSPHALKFLFLAGNEAPDQDPYVRYQEMSELARQEGILVNAVFCGQAESEAAAGWKDMAILAEGNFASIDHNLPAVLVTTSVDAELVELGQLMNQTYVAFGENGKSTSKSRARQDKNARKEGLAVAAARAMTKASPVYFAHHDLVEAHDRGSVNVLSVADSELPRSLRAMTPEERLNFVQEMSDIRRELRSRIAELGFERRRAVAERMTLHSDASKAFDQVVRSTIRERAQEAGFYFPEG